MKSKLSNVGTTIFSQVSALAAKHNAINLGQGFPDFDPDPILLECVTKSVKDSFHQYAPMAGYLPLRDVLSEQHHNTLKQVSDNVTITAGGTQAIFTAISAFVGKGDEVIVFEPVYDCYLPAIELNGGVPRIITTYPPLFEIDWSEVKASVTDLTKMIIINTPNNPTGKLFTTEDFAYLSEIVSSKPIVILSDEVYEDIIIGHNKYISPHEIDSIKDQTISVHSLGKILGCTGWKIGYIIASEMLTREFRKVHQFNVFSVNSFLQLAIVEYFNSKPQARLSLRQFYSQKYELMNSLFSNSFLQPLKPEGSFFQIFSYGEDSLRDDASFNLQLIHSVGVAGIPLSAFYPSGAVQSGYIRFCFGKKDETLITASKALEKYLIR